MSIESITCNGVKVDRNQDGVWINDQLDLTDDQIHGLLEALGLLGYDLRGYTLPEVAGETE